MPLWICTAWCELQSRTARWTYNENLTVEYLQKLKFKSLGERGRKRRRRERKHSSLRRNPSFCKSPTSLLRSSFSLSLALSVCVGVEWLDRIEVPVWFRASLVLDLRAAKSRGLFVLDLKTLWIRACLLLNLIIQWLLGVIGGWSEVLFCGVWWGKVKEEVIALRIMHR